MNVWEARVLRLKSLKLSIILMFAAGLAPRSFAGKFDVNCSINTVKDGLTLFPHCATRDPDGAVHLSPKIRAKLVFDKYALSGIFVGAECYWTNKAGVTKKTYCYDNGPDYFSEGLARYVDQDRKIGFMNRKLKIVIPPHFDFAEPFESGKSQFCNGCKMVPDGEHFRMDGGTWGAIDKKGNPTSGASPKTQGVRQELRYQ